MQGLLQLPAHLRNASDRQSRRLQLTRVSASFPINQSVDKSVEVELIKLIFPSLACRSKASQIPRQSLQSSQTTTQRKRQAPQVQDDLFYEAPPASVPASLSQQKSAADERRESGSLGQRDAVRFSSPLESGGQKQSTEKHISRSSLKKANASRPALDRAQTSGLKIVTEAVNQAQVTVIVNPVRQLSIR